MTSYSGKERRFSHVACDCAGGCDEVKNVDARLISQFAHIESIEGVLVRVHSRLDDHDTKIGQIHADILKNNDETSQVLDIVKAGKGFFKVLDWFASIIKWTLALAAPVIAFWYAIKSGGKV